MIQFSDREKKWFATRVTHSILYLFSHEVVFVGQSLHAID